MGVAQTLYPGPDKLLYAHKTKLIEGSKSWPRHCATNNQGLLKMNPLSYYKKY